ncbi:RNB domain-containing ribonuclease [Sphingomonas sp. ASV193]|uniref:RNB domain-containing ribonuclease n=1 Tax=Sphingomonas sp. ASV193 TaxID=3144405 RepID=UPI0032E8E0B1
MKTLVDPAKLLSEGLAAIRAQYDVPAAFPDAVQAEAEEAAKRVPGADHADRTGVDFVTLDPATSRDLDQAFAIQAAGSDLILSYAIADVGFFVDDGSALDTEAWARGETLYLPDGKAGLYPPVLSEGAASLLPDAAKPAIVFAVRVAPDGTASLDGVERAVIRSRAKLAYDAVIPDQLPRGFAELSKRVMVAEAARGAARADPPEQEVVPDNGGYRLQFRPHEASEDDNASLSLACNLAVAKLLAVHHTGLFRVMPEPWDSAVKRLRHTAQAFGIDWSKDETLDALKRRLDPADPKQAALMLAIRKASPGASYAAWKDDAPPWHAAMAAAYLHCTAPLRRLGDRYDCLAALALANGKPVPDAVQAAFARLPKAMARAENKGNAVDKAVIDLAETVALEGHEGETFGAVVTDVDDRGTRIQLCDQPVVARMALAGAAPGQALTVRLVSADPATRELRFEPEGAADAAV